MSSFCSEDDENVLRTRRQQKLSKSSRLTKKISYIKGREKSLLGEKECKRMKKIMKQFVMELDPSLSPNPLSIFVKALLLTLGFFSHSSRPAPLPLIPYLKKKKN